MIHADDKPAFVRLRPRQWLYVCMLYVCFAYAAFRLTWTERFWQRTGNISVNNNIHVVWKVKWWRKPSARRKSEKGEHEKVNRTNAQILCVQPLLHSEHSATDVWQVREFRSNFVYDKMSPRKQCQPVVHWPLAHFRFQYFWFCSRFFDRISAIFSIAPSSVTHALFLAADKLVAQFWIYVWVWAAEACSAWIKQYGPSIRSFVHFIKRPFCIRHFNWNRDNKPIHMNLCFQFSF